MSCGLKVLNDDEDRKIRGVLADIYITYICHLSIFSILRDNFSIKFAF